MNKLCKAGEYNPVSPSPDNSSLFCRNVAQWERSYNMTTFVKLICRQIVESDLKRRPCWSDVVSVQFRAISSSEKSCGNVTG